MSSGIEVRSPATARGDVPSRMRELFHRPTGLVGALIVLALTIAVVFGPSLAPYDAATQDIARRLEGPSRDHLLGTDELGRDLFSRLLVGTRIAIGVGVVSVLAALAVGLVIGLVAGYVGGWIESTLLVVMDTLQAFPAVILALALLAVLGPSLRNVVIVIVISFAPAYARVARALVATEKVNPYVDVERALGANDGRIVIRHILPNVIPPLFILLAMDIPSAIAVEAGLSFLGVGVQPPTPSWGLIMSDGFDRVRDTPWPVLWAGLALMVTTLGFTLLGEVLRDVYDPRLSGLRRWRRA